jgi:hypothetical protein
LFPSRSPSESPTRSPTDYENEQAVDDDLTTTEKPAQTTTTLQNAKEAVVGGLLANNTIIIVAVIIGSLCVIVIITVSVLMCPRRSWVNRKERARSVSVQSLVETAVISMVSTEKVRTGVTEVDHCERELPSSELLSNTTSD